MNFGKCQPNDLLAYILLGHPDWKKATIKIQCCFFPRIPIDEGGSGTISGSSKQDSAHFKPKKTLSLSPKNRAVSIKHIINEKIPGSRFKPIVGLWKRRCHLGIQSL